MKLQRTNNLRRSSRRSMLKGTITGVAGVAAIAGVATTGLILTHQDSPDAAHAQGSSHNNNNDNWDQKAANKAIANILNIAITAEELGVVFYSQVVKNARRLDLSQNGLADIQAALTEEQIHQSFLAKQGAKALTNTFSFPFGQNTFTNFDHFLQTQQQLEAMFVAAYLAAAKEFATWRRPDLVLIASQIGGVEAEHRAVGRAIGGLRPANNRAFETALLKTVADAPNALKKAGFLAPKNGNTFTFHPVPTNLNNIVGRTPTATDQN
jgi:Ferritin-like domain